MKKPLYPGTCACRKTGGQTLVIHVWPASQHQMFRNKSNSTKFYPEIETCSTHASGLKEVGKDFIFVRWLQAVDFCKGMGRGEPDIRDVLFEVVTTEEALKMWADSSIDPPRPEEGGRIVAVKDIDVSKVLDGTLH